MPRTLEQVILTFSDMGTMYHTMIDVPVLTSAILKCGRRFTGVGVYQDVVTRGQFSCITPLIYALECLLT